MARMELDAAAGLVGLTFIQMFSMYRETAPKLMDVRAAPPGDYGMRQMILDADILVGGLAIGIGVVTSFLAGSYLPVVLILAGFGMVSFYYHAVCFSDPPIGG